MKLRFLAALIICAALCAAESAPQTPLNVLVVTGGHGFDRKPFFDMFRALPGITFDEVEHPGAHSVLTPVSARKYDAVVLYDMWQPISEDARKQFIAMLKEGKGLVGLHHSLCGYNGWPEYRKIIGGRYRVGKEGDRPASVYKHDVNFRVKVRGGHPVSTGLSDFDVFDETYGDFDVNPGVRPLLTADEPTSGKTVGWAHAYGRSRVVYIQPGHGPQIFSHPSYRKLLGQAIRWVAAPTDARTPMD